MEEDGTEVMEKSLVQMAQELVRVHDKWQESIREGLKKDAIIKLLTEKCERIVCYKVEVMIGELNEDDLCDLMKVKHPGREIKVVEIK